MGFPMLSMLPWVCFHMLNTFFSFCLIKWPALIWLSFNHKTSLYAFFLQDTRHKKPRKEELAVSVVTSLDKQTALQNRHRLPSLYKAADTLTNRHSPEDHAGGSHPHATAPQDAWNVLVCSPKRIERNWPLTSTRQNTEKEAQDFVSAFRVSLRLPSVTASLWVNKGIWVCRVAESQQVYVTRR